MAHDEAVSGTDVKLCLCGELIHLVGDEWKRVGREKAVSACRVSGRLHEPASYILSRLTPEPAADVSGRTCIHCRKPIWLSTNSARWVHVGERNSLVCYPDQNETPSASPAPVLKVQEGCITYNAVYGTVREGAHPELGVVYVREPAPEPLSGGGDPKENNEDQADVRVVRHVEE